MRAYDVPDYMLEEPYSETDERVSDLESTIDDLKWELEVVKGAIEMTNKQIKVATETLQYEIDNNLRCVAAWHEEMMLPDDDERKAYDIDFYKKLIKDAQDKAQALEAVKATLENMQELTLLEEVLTDAV